MTVNYHTHTVLCRHAVGGYEEYIKEAISAGIKKLGFSDHTPLPLRKGDTSAGGRMTFREAEEYFASLLSLKEKYKSEIEIKIGFETEYYPRLWERLKAEYKKLPVDYLLLAQHAVPDFPPSRGGSLFSVKERSSFVKTDSEEVLRSYVDLVCEAMRTGVFTYVAHPDVINFVGDGEIYLRQMSRIIELSNEMKIPLEINMKGIQKGLVFGEWTSSHYPSLRFWRLAGELSASAVIGADAHAPWELSDTRAREIALEIARDSGVKLLSDIELIKPDFG